MHTWQILAFITFAVGCVLGVIERAYVLALIAGGLAVMLIPAVFELK